MKVAGVVLVFIGCLSGWEFMAEWTGIESLNALTKDQLSVVFGALMVVIAGRER